MARLGSTTTARAREMGRVLQRWERSGLTLKAFGEREGIPASTLVWWRHVFRHRGTARRPHRIAKTTKRSRPPQHFVEVHCDKESVGRTAVLELVLRSGHVVRVPAGVDAAALHTVIGVLEGTC